ncbi:Histidinol-phosphate aminotransferase [Dirofilaria immitis]
MRHSGRRNGRRWLDGMAKHVDAVMKRAKDRRKNLINPFKKVPERLTQPISPHKRLKERAGLWMFAKQSEIITEPSMITSSVRRKVHEDVRAIMAEDSRDRRQLWNIARQETMDNINDDSAFRMPSTADNVFGIPSCVRFGKKAKLESPVNDATAFNTKEDSTLFSGDFPTRTRTGSNKKTKDNKDACLFPADPLMLDYAERILSALPQLFLRNDDRTTYSTAATGIVACSLRRHGVYPKGSNFQEKQLLETSQRENDTNEKLWRSFFENSSPLNSFMVGSPFRTGSSSSSVKLFEFEDIPINTEHVLSNSDDANTTLDVYQSPKNPSHLNISDCNFSDFYSKIGRNDFGSSANLSINSNDLKLEIDKDFPTNNSCNSSLRQLKFDLDDYHPITVSAWFEKDSANMSDTCKITCRNAVNDKARQNYQPMGRNFINPAVNEVPTNSQWMKNSSMERKIRSEMPDFHFRNILKNQNWLRRFLRVKRMKHSIINNFAVQFVSIVITMWISIYILRRAFIRFSSSVDLL